MNCTFKWFVEAGQLPISTIDKIFIVLPTVNAKRDNLNVACNRVCVCLFYSIKSMIIIKNRQKQMTLSFACEKYVTSNWVVVKCTATRPTMTINKGIMILGS